MTSEVEEDLSALLEGNPKERQLHVDIAVPGEENFVPIAKRTVCYIVCGLVFNEHGEILMMQEAKSSCYGMWYLPAGRMEPNETIQEAVKREVLEETGIEFEPTTLVSVEVASGFWYRFALTGHISGGTLKTYEHRDKESLQAKWCSIDTVKSGRKGFPLRASDILPLIDLGLKHRNSVRRHPDVLPSQLPHKKLLLRLVCSHMTENGVNVLLGKTPECHFPVGAISVEDSTLYFAIFRLAKILFNAPLKPTPSVKGVLSVEHCGKPAYDNDGLCITLLLQIHSPDPQQPNQPLPIKHPDHFEWVPIEKTEILQGMKERIQQNLFVPLLLLR